VINTSTNTVTATVTLTAVNPNGVAVSPDGTRVYVTNLLAGTVSVINTSTNTVTATVTVGSNPEGVAVSPDGTRVYVANNGVGGRVSVIATSTNIVAATVTVGASPYGVAVSSDGRRVYVTNNGAGARNLSVIDGVATPPSSSPPSTDSGAPSPVKPPTLAETGPDLSLVLVGSGVSALMLVMGVAATLAARRKLAAS
jgi:YVTN family beta-propeller protein